LLYLVGLRAKAKTLLIDKGIVPSKINICLWERGLL
jgi:hypothetical protein